MRLAPELLDLVISFLEMSPGETDSHFRAVELDSSPLPQVIVATLGRIGLVCRDWLPSSRRLIFHTLRITKPNAYRFALLFRRPERLTFLPFIRRLIFTQGIADNRWMTTVLPKILPHLHSVLGLTLCATDGCRPAPRLYSPAISSITSLTLSDPSYMRGCNLERQIGLSEIVACVSSFPVPEQLRLRLNTNWGTDTIPIGDHNLPSSLKVLDVNLHSVEPFFSWIVANAAATAISTLAITFPSFGKKESDYVSSQLIASLGASLTSLTISLEDPQNTPDSHTFTGIDLLNTNTELRTLAVKGTLPQITLLFQNMRTYPPLETITLYVLRGGDRVALLKSSTTVGYVYDMRQGWSELDDIFAPLSLERLRIELPVLSAATWSGDSWIPVPIALRSGIAEGMPKCVAQRIVTTVSRTDVEDL
ncbi:hypothetical protein C8J57DRAFT_1314554 [Mycena rebaudengoi]|nr:hypothetical protein C8J57DRAFT_1314554 [Mycena rebaudengoi]